MKAYVEYMNSVTVTADLHEKILARTAQKPAPPVKIRSFPRYAAPAALAAACLIILCGAFLAIPGLLNAPGENTGVGSGPSVSFKPGGSQPGDYDLTLKQARSDADFGAYVSMSVPSQFSFTSAQKSTDPDGDSLSVLWKQASESSGGSIAWTISKPAAGELDRIVHVNEREKYDMMLYSSPWDQSVPEELRGYFGNPVFLSEELTLDALRARVYHTDDDRREARGLRMDFSVLYGDVVVLVQTKGASPEQLYDMLTGLKDPQTSFKKSARSMEGWVSASGN